MTDSEDTPTTARARKVGVKLKLGKILAQTKALVGKIQTKLVLQLI